MKTRIKVEDSGGPIRYYPQYRWFGRWLSITEEFEGETFKVITKNLKHAMDVVDEFRNPPEKTKVSYIEYP
jgi:hypothetical protein